MATGDSPANASDQARPRGASVWRALGWIGILLWLSMLAINTTPYLSGRPLPAGSALLASLLAPPAALGLPPALVAELTPLISTLAAFLIVLIIALTISPTARETATPALRVAPPAPTPAPKPPAPPKTVRVRVRRTLPPQPKDLSKEDTDILPAIQMTLPEPHVPMPAPLTPATATKPLPPEAPDDLQPTPKASANITTPFPPASATNPLPPEPPATNAGNPLEATTKLDLTPRLVQEPPTATESAAQPRFTPWVFISHSSKNDDFGKRLNADLRAALAPNDPGRVWYDSAPERGEEEPESDDATADGAQPGGLTGGMNFPREIVEQIAARNVAIVILSPEATRSRWVRYEIDQAINRYNGPERFAIYPVVYRNCALPHALSIFQTLDFTSADTDPDAYQRQLGELVALIREGRVNLSESAPPFELGLLPEPQHLIGRDADLDWALDRLRAGETTAVTAFGGMGGIGKSALAAVAIRRLRQERAFPDGIVVVSCENKTDPVEALRLTLIPFTPGRRTPDASDLPGLAAVAQKLLGGKRTLITLDNIEPEWPIEQVTAPLAAADATLLLTARQMLPVAAVPLDGVRRLDLLSPEDALLLFAQSYGRRDADALSAEEREHATRIVALLDRHTLAVRLAGAYAAELGRPLARVAEEIASDVLRIPEGETPRKVDAVLARSVDALPPEGQRLFAALATIATGEFGRKAALALARGLGLADPEATVELLVRRALLDASMDTSLPADTDAERLRLHPLFQAEAALRFAAWSANDRADALRAMAIWYARYADNAATPDGALTLDEANIGGALAWAEAAKDDPLLAHLCNGMANYWRIRSRTDDRKHYLPLAAAAAQRVAEATGKRDDRLQAGRLEGHHGDLLLLLGDVAAARAAYDRVLAIMRAVGDQQQEGVALSLLGDLALREGDVAAARAAYERYLAIMRAVGDQREEGVALYKLALLLEAQDELDEAEAYHRQSLEISRRVQDPEGDADVLMALGQFLLRHGRGGDEGRAMLAEAAAIYERLGMAEEAEAARVAMGGEADGGGERGASD